ncbi:MAG: mannose-1-phosphate guanylyltransferase/mannose-6-phosphate isomerase, partial [Methanobacteriota archaeon]
MIGLILAGGSGTRLWPLSRELHPKQFLRFGSSDTLLQQTVKRASHHCEELVVVTGEAQYFMVKHQLEGLGIKDRNIIREPAGRNTAPAIALGCRFILDSYGDENILAMPSDHIMDSSFFQEAKKAEKHTDRYLCTFGVKPTHPSTGYGYIKLGERKDGGYLVERFLEKPDAKTAEELLRRGGYLWNSGIFLFRASLILEEFRAHLPEIHRHLTSVEGLLARYEELPTISIDHGIMEKTEKAVVLPFEKGWRDVGSWKSVYELLGKDERGNASKGDVLSMDTENSLIMGEDRLIAAIGLRDMVIVDTKDALLAAPKDRAEEVKEVVEKLRRENRSEAMVHTTVYRPWGYYTVLESGERYKVKRLTIYPKKAISYQMHYHRAEHWIVVKGTARITKEDTVVNVHENESIYVPKSTRHKVENPGKVELHIIEIQTGEYIEEDDIIRFD